MSWLSTEAHLIFIRLVIHSVDALIAFQLSDLLIAKCIRMWK